MKADKKAPGLVRVTETPPDEDVEMVRRLMASKANEKAADKSQIAPLFLASRDGHTEIVKLFLQRGVNVNISIEDGSTPLFWAVYGGRPEVVKLLLAAKADPNIRVKNRELVLTPLGVAKSKGHQEIVRLLAAHGARE